MITLRNHALRSYMTWLPVTLTCLPVTLTLLSYNLQLWRHRRWFRKLPVRFRPIRKEIASSMYNNYTCQYPRLFINFFGFNGIGKCWRFEAWLLRSSKNAFIMQSKSTFLEFFDGNLSLQMWPAEKFFRGKFFRWKWRHCNRPCALSVSRFPHVSGQLVCLSSQLTFYSRLVCLLAVWTVIKQVALFTFEDRVTGILKTGLS